MTEEHLENLIRKYAEGTATPEEVEQLHQWYRSGPEGEVRWPAAEAAEREEVYHRMLQRLQRDAAPRRARVFRLAPLRAAALLLVVAGAALLAYYFGNRLRQPEYVTVVNPAGRILPVRLPDGSTVWLNAATTLRYAKAFARDRKLELTGEAYFRVVRDKARPFTVSARGLQTTVLGTSFNIRAYAEDRTATVSVTGGLVRVSAAEKSLAVLSPQSQVRYDQQTGAAQTARVDTASVLAWQKGRLQFDGQTLAEIGITLERWYGVRIEFAQPGMRGCRYYMGFDTSISLEKLLTALSGLSDMTYTVDKNKNLVRLSGPGCR